MSLPLLPNGKVALFAVDTGHRFVRWPVDATDMLRSGAYTLTEPVALPAEPMVLPTPSTDLPQDLEQMTKAQLGAFARTVLSLPLDTDKMTKAEMVTAVRGEHAALFPDVG